MDTRAASVGEKYGIFSSILSINMNNRQNSGIDSKTKPMSSPISLLLEIHINLLHKIIMIVPMCVDFS